MKLMWSQVVIVTNEEERRGVVEEVGEDVLPVEFGGKAKLIAIQDVVLPQLAAWMLTNWMGCLYIYIYVCICNKCNF